MKQHRSRHAVQSTASSLREFSVHGTARRWIVAAGLVSALCYVALTMASRSHADHVSSASRPREPVGSSSVVQPAIPAHLMPSSAPTEVELVTLNREGFVPSELNLRKSHFLLAVDNRSEVEAVALRLDRVAGARMQDVYVPREKLDWRVLVDLPPGQYVLSEASHPDWICRINISPP